MSEHRPSSGSQESVPLSVRVLSMMISRVVLTPVTVGAAALSGIPASTTSLRWAGAYLLATGLLSVTVLVPAHRLAVFSFGLTLLLDGIYLQYQHETIGDGGPVAIAIVTHLVISCLLASFRSGLSLAIWQSLLMVFALRAEQVRLFPMPAWSAGVNRDRILLTDCAMYWLAVLAACVTAAVNERELRRRRNDAEALRVFAEQLQGDQSPAEVGNRLCQFIAAELMATRVLVCRPKGAGWQLEAAFGLVASVPPQPEDGVRGPALFTVPTGAENEVLSLHLDPESDRWLVGLLPDARRIMAFSMGATPSGPDADRWLVVEHGAVRGGRVETRLITTAAQAAATAAIAVSRAHLLQAAQRAAATDGLTGLANRRTFDEHIDRLMAAWHRHGQVFSLVLVDVDKFKSVNDQHGHQAGDHVLQAVAAALARSCRGSELPARYGGEEFAVLLPQTDGAQAVLFAERLRLAVQQAKGRVPVTASFGVASVPADASSGDEVIFRADTALIQAKETGRNRVVQTRPENESHVLTGPRPRSTPA